MGIRTQELIVAAFVGSTGDFLAQSPNTFVIVTPKMQHCMSTTSALQKGANLPDSFGLRYPGRGQLRRKGH